MRHCSAYAERIERVARVLAGGNDAEWERAHPLTKRYFREQARAADAVVLEAIREPTEEMLTDGLRSGVLKETEGGIEGISVYPARVYRAMHAAISRGEET